MSLLKRDEVDKAAKNYNIVIQIPEGLKKEFDDDYGLRAGAMLAIADSVVEVDEQTKHS